MLTEQQLVDQRERQIKADDHDDDIYISSLLGAARGSVADTLKYFRDRYATDGVLTVSDMRTNVNDRDFAKWQSFMAKRGPRLMKDLEAKFRLDGAKSQAGLDREHLMNSMVSIAISYATLGINQYNRQALLSEANRSLEFQNKVLRARNGQPLYLNDDLEQRAQAFINQTTNGLTMDKSAWLRTDKLRDQLNSALDRALQVGIDDDYYQNYLFRDGSNSPKSASKQFDSANGYLANSLLRNSKAGIVSMAGAFMAEQNGLSMAYWHDVEDERVCEQCIELANGGPYPAWDIPGQPHYGCRCFLVYFNF